MTQAEAASPKRMQVRRAVQATMDERVAAATGGLLEPAQGFGTDPNELPAIKPEDFQYFSKLLEAVDEDNLNADEAKELKIMRLLLKIKNGSPPQRKTALRQMPDKAREFGVTSEEISSVMASYFSGTVYSTFREGDEQIPIVLRASRNNRDSVEDLANLSIAANGELISIDQVAEFRPQLEYSEIRRENQVRQIIISAKSDSLAAGQLLERIQPSLDGLDLGAGYSITIGGELEDTADVNGQLGGNLPYALGVMILALVFQFNSIRRTLITFMTIPIILIGAPFALMLTDRPMSFFAMLGLMSLMGIIINNAIVLINQIDINLQTMNVRDAIVRASEQRAKPVILTSLTTVGGLIPMAISGGALFEPMATIMIGGLIVASPLTLIFVPSVCYLFMRNEKAATGEPLPS